MWGTWCARHTHMQPYPFDEFCYSLCVDVIGMKLVPRADICNLGSPRVMIITFFPTSSSKTLNKSAVKSSIL